MFELSKEHEDFRKVVREFAEAEVEPHIAKWDRDHHFPADLVPKMGELGLFGLVVPEEFGGMGDDGDFTSSASRSRSSAGSTSRSASRCRPASGLGINPILTYGSQEQKERFLPDLVAGRALAGLRADRAGRRLRRRCHPHQGGPRRRRVGRQRLQGVHHQLRHRHHLGRHGHRPHRHQRRRLGPAQRDHDPFRHAGLHRRAGLRQARLARLRHPRPDLRGLPRPGRQPARPARATASSSSSRPSTTAASPSRALAVGLTPAAARGDHRLRQDPQGVRQADRRQPGRLLPDRRPRRHGRGRPAS